MSIDVMSWVWNNAEASGTELLLLLAIADNANSQGEAWPSVHTLSNKIRQTTRNTQIVIRKLEEDGQLLIDPPGKKHRTNTYRIPFTEELQAEALRRAAIIRWVKLLSGIGRAMAFRGKVNHDSGVGGETAFRGGVNHDSSEPSLNHQVVEPSEKTELLLLPDNDLTWGEYVPPANATPMPSALKDDPGMGQGDEGDSPPCVSGEVPGVEIFYAANIAALTPHMSDTLTSAITQYGESEVLYALQQAVEYGKRNWPYAEAICKRRAHQAKDSLSRSTGEGLGEGTNDSAIQRFLHRDLMPEPCAIPEPCQQEVTPGMTVHNAWQIARVQLELQLDHGSFDTWLRDVTLSGFDPATNTVTFSAQNPIAAEMLQYRLYRNVWRVLADVTGCESIALQFNPPASGEPVGTLSITSEPQKAVA